MSVYKIRERAIAQMEAWARDDSHGYDQTHRWGERGDYDCSAAVIDAWQRAGVPVKSAGATYTGNMRDVFLRLGFEDVTANINLANGSGLIRSDVLLNHQRHTAMYCGNGQEVEASINELGTATGGRPGDQTGREFLARPYRNYPWDCVLRYMGHAGAADAAEDINVPATEDPPTADLVESCSPEVPVLQRGQVSAAVAAIQGALQWLGYDIGASGVDGDFGPATQAAVRTFQDDMEMTPSGVVDADTWEALMSR